MAAIDFEALRSRHAESRPLMALTDEELEALRAAAFETFSAMHRLVFLASLERNARAES